MRSSPTRLLCALLLLISWIGVRQNAYAQTTAGAGDIWFPRHQITVYAPDVTPSLDGPLNLGLARATSLCVSYQHAFSRETFLVGAFAGPALTHPRLVGLAGRWSGAEAGVSVAAGLATGRYFWFGMQLRGSVVRSPFRLDGFVLAPNGSSFEPRANVRVALRQNNLELGGLIRAFLGSSGLYLTFEGGAVAYGRGVFSEADLYPNFTSRAGLVFFPGVVRLPQNEYRLGFALRGRLGLGIGF